MEVIPWETDGKIITKNNIFYIRKEDIQTVIDNDGFIIETIIGDGYIRISSFPNGVQNIYVNGKLQIRRKDFIVPYPII